MTAQSKPWGRGARKPRMRYESGLWYHSARPDDCTPGERIRWDDAYRWRKRMQKRAYRRRMERMAAKFKG